MSSKQGNVFGMKTEDLKKKNPFFKGIKNNGKGGRRRKEEELNEKNDPSQVKR